MSAVGATDYGFLYSGASSIGHIGSFRVRSVLSRGEGEEENKKPSIDDFDGEISIFKVHQCDRHIIQHVWILTLK